MSNFKKKITQTEEGTFCGQNGCKGAVFRVEVSRMEEAFGHRKYQCDKCSTSYKYDTSHPKH